MSLMTTWATVNMYVPMLTHRRYRSNTSIPSTAGIIRTSGMMTITTQVVVLHADSTSTLRHSILVGNIPHAAAC